MYRGLNPVVLANGCPPNMQELFYGNTAAAQHQGWQSCLRVPDLPTLAEVTSQQLKTALAAAETAVLQQLAGGQQKQQQTADAPQVQQGALAPGADVETAADAPWQQQQQQMPASLAEVCRVLGLDSGSYQALLEETALIAEVSRNCFLLSPGCTAQTELLWWLAGSKCCCRMTLSARPVKPI